MAEYTPTTDYVRESWADFHWDGYGDTPYSKHLADFDRWLAAHTADAILAAANHIHGIHPSPFEQLTAYAERVREGNA